MIVKVQKNCIIYFLYNFWPLLPKFYFWKEDWALRYVSMPFWDVSNISQFPKSYAVRHFVNQVPQSFLY